MFETFELLTLQQYWWIIISLLASLLVFLMFVQGGQTLIYTLGKTDTERSMIVNTLGRKWELTFTTLVTFGGAFFASFPLFYSTSFGGAYWVWMAILFAFIIQAISYEYRSKPNNFLGKRTFEVFLFINGALGTILIGTAVGTFFNGAMFSVDKLNLTNIYDSAISRWETPFHGLEAVLNFHNVALGLSVFFLARVLGILYIVNSVSDENIHGRARKQMLYNAVPFLLFFLYFVIHLLLKQGFAVNPDTGEVFMEKFKYFHNLIQMPVVLVLFLAGVVGVLAGIGRFLFCRSNKGIWFTGAGTVLAVFALFLIAGLNNTAFYPSLHNLQHSLTIRNSSSSHYTLTAMSYVSLFVPVVITYIFFAWKSINNKPIEKAELEEEGTHIY
ncbi:cytochrome d ubiquinol oxidase subunit II [Lentimicrobium sp.]|jgi:cytochrome d ubiquinol oxidase subunit II|uniref:cytochrome d ubiquinol oxidase subunit II n=1 Tax=Lentimicrobium sp. TaxID=2034841 RepID=UPI002C14C8CE|nr:cytochrome d ubiquinol oxidase subunit II [Lentimicrobium sp.]HPR25299.1 cytochrome d ubiquinol oxidase subunit II [Lentimicrobium sp.]